MSSTSSLVQLVTQASQAATLAGEFANQALQPVGQAQTYAAQAAVSASSASTSASSASTSASSASTSASSAASYAASINPGVANGVATLDASAKIPIAQIPSSVGTGTVTSIAASSTSGELSITGSPITSSGTLNLALAATSVVAGSYGAPTRTAAITVDAKGRITGASDFPISVAATSVSGLATVATSGKYGDLSGKPVFAPAAYGAVGDGVTDDTTALQAMLNAMTEGSVAILGKHLISNTLTVTANDSSLIGGKIIPSSTPVGGGNLANYFTCFKLNSVHSVTFSDIEFVGPTTGSAYVATNYGSAMIKVINSTDSAVLGCTFDITNSTGITALNSLNAVWFGACGGGLISGNYFAGVGCQYAESGSYRMMVTGNVSVSAPANAFTGTQNTNGTFDGHVVSNNYIRNAGRMGIEDWMGAGLQISIGSQITGNVILTTGVNYPTLGYGISSVTQASSVSNNRCQDCPAYAFEVPAENSSVTGNVAAWTTPGPTNGTGFLVLVGASGGSIDLIGNTVYGASVGFYLYGPTGAAGTGSINVSGNSGSAVYSRYIDTNFYSTSTCAVNVLGNIFEFNTPFNAASGAPARLFVAVAAGSSSGYFSITGNQFRVTSGAAGSTYPGGVYFLLVASQTVAIGNLYDSGGITVNGAYYSIYDNGNTSANCVFKDNVFAGGAFYSLNYLTSPTIQGNVGFYEAIETYAPDGTGQVTMRVRDRVAIISGTAGVKTLVGANLSGNVINLIFTGAPPGGTLTGGNIAKAATVAQNQALTLVFSGGLWYPCG